MTPDDIAAMVAAELAAYRYEVPTGTLGRPWAPERVAAQLDQLRAALIPPQPTRLSISARGGAPARVSAAWIVARAGDGLYLVYEPEYSVYWLAEGADSAALSDIAVDGDLVGTFMAR